MTSKLTPNLPSQAGQGDATQAPQGDATQAPPEISGTRSNPSPAIDLGLEFAEGPDIMLPPMAGGSPGRLLVFLHGAGSSPGQIVTAAIAWQQKFRSARAVLLAAPHQADGGTLRYWARPDEYPVQAGSIRGEAEAVAGRIRTWQQVDGFDGTRTIVVGFSQGASIALELAFAPHQVASLVIGFAARLYRLPVRDDSIEAVIHLIHGRYDSVVPLGHGETALRRLGQVGAVASLDVIEEGSHVVDQEQLNVATQRAMHSLFANRRAGGDTALH